MKTRYIIKCKMSSGTIFAPRPMYYVYRKGWIFNTYISAYETLAAAKDAVKLLTARDNFKGFTLHYDGEGKLITTE